MKFETYSRTFLHFHTEEVPELLIKYLPKNAFSLVDLGAGDGALLVALQRGGYLSYASNVTAVDLSAERCERLRQNADFHVLCSDVTNAPGLISASFDYVICTQVIEHVDQEKLLTEIKRIMSTNGMVYIASLVKKWYGWWYYKTSDGKWAIDPTHLREYASAADFEKVIREAGLEVVETKLSPLKLSVLEFIVRRIIVPLFHPQDVNDFFLKHHFANWLRNTINVRPPGYYIVESIAKK